MIWIIGNKGLLGREVSHYLGGKGHHIVGTDKEVSILSPLAMEEHIKEFPPRWIINCSGFKDIKGAEDTWDKAYMINKKGAASVARIASQLKIPLIHISTSEIFDGKKREPITENDPPRPLNVYGASKLAGEEAVRSITPRHFIIRTFWLYGEYGPNSIFDMLHQMNKLPAFRISSRKTGNPTWTRDLASLIAFIIINNLQDYGTYHYSSAGECSPRDLALFLFRCASRQGLISNPCSILPAVSSGEEGRVKRPDYTVLSKEKIKMRFKTPVPEWKESLRKFLGSITNEHIVRYEQAITGIA